MDWAFANGIQILTHANGEAAQDMLIAAIDAATTAQGADANRRPVLIHGQFMREDQADSYKRLGVFPSLFPMHTFYWGDCTVTTTVGPALADDISPTGWLVKRGMMFSTHHDAPVAFPNSMRVLECDGHAPVAVGRHHRAGPAGDVMTALKAMTIWPAWSHFEEDSKGSIEVGKLADLVILSGDPTAVDPDTLDSLTVSETVKEGTSVFVAGAKEGLLDYRPLQDGTDPFGGFLREQTIRWELAGSGDGKGVMDVNRMARLMAAQPHNPGCVANFLTALLMNDGEPGQPALR